MILTDFHVHSSFSSDSEAPMEDMIKAAIEKGLGCICFTEHQDFHYPPGGSCDFQLDAEAYWERVTQLKEQYKRQITVLRGIELGLSEGMEEEGAKLLASYPFDFVIGSMHVMDGKDPYYPSFWEGAPREEILRRWYVQMAENIRRFPDFDALGHLDYVSRYMPGGPKEYRGELFEEEIEEILMLLIEKKKALEINTNAYRYGSIDPHPQRWVIERYQALGGIIFTVGSDAHVPERVAQEFPRTEQLLTELGIRESSLYVGRERFRLTFSR